MVTKGPKYRKFSTAAEAGEYVKDWKKFVEKEKSAALEDDAEEVLEVEDGPSAKKLKVESKSDVKHEGGRPEKVYTDGSSLGNGKAGSSAGVGVYFGPNDPRFVSSFQIFAKHTKILLGTSQNLFQASFKRTRELNFVPSKEPWKFSPNLRT